MAVLAGTQEATEFGGCNYDSRPCRRRDIGLERLLEEICASVRGFLVGVEPGHADKHHLVFVTYYPSAGAYFTPVVTLAMRPIFSH